MGDEASSVHGVAQQLLTRQSALVQCAGKLIELRREHARVAGGQLYGQSNQQTSQLLVDVV